MKQNPLRQQADAIVDTFRGKKYDASSLMVVLTYALTRIMRSVIAQNSYPKAMAWFYQLVNNVAELLDQQDYQQNETHPTNTHQA